jgi:hypothetical protein
MWSQAEASCRLPVPGTAETNSSQMFSDPRWIAAAIHDRAYKRCLFRDGIIQRKREPRSQRAMIVLVNDGLLLSSRGGTRCPQRVGSICGFGRLIFAPLANYL